MGSTPNNLTIDPAQAALDRKRELDIKEREVAAKECEVLAKEEELKRSRWLNPTVMGDNGTDGSTPKNYSHWEERRDTFPSGSR
jgi:hypothetical protein